MDQLTEEEIQELRDKQMTDAQIEELLQEQKAREDEAEAEEYQKAFFLLDKDKDGKIGIFGQFGPGNAGLFSALLVGPLVVVARGLYLARHLFTLL